MNDQFAISLSFEQINAILRQLDSGPHNVVRPLIDSIISQVQAQQQARQKAAPANDEGSAE
jgi:hypothetical protein